MQDKYQLFTAFFIPFSAALVLLYFFSGLFPVPVYESTSGISFGIYGAEYSSLLVELKQLYQLMIFSLFVLSFALPVFVDSRSEAIERTEIKLFDK